MQTSHLSEDKEDRREGVMILCRIGKFELLSSTSGKGLVNEVDEEEYAELTS